MDKQLELALLETTYYIGYFSCFDSVSSVWGPLVHFAKFPALKLSKGYYSHSFHPISTKLYGNYGNQGGKRAIYFWRSAKF